jgi:hypothetical protein
VTTDQEPAERPAPLIFMAAPSDPGDVTFGSYAAVLATGRHLLAGELSQRLARQGAAVQLIPPDRTPGAFHWGSWYTAAVQPALVAASGKVDAIGWVGAGALALFDDQSLDDLLSPVPGEVVANNRFSADAFVVAGDLPAAMGVLAGLGSDNGAPRGLQGGGFTARDLSTAPWSRFDVDTPLDLALLRLAIQLPGVRRLDLAVATFVAGAQLPGGHPLEIPRLQPVLETLRSRDAEIVIAGRVPSAVFAYVEEQAACRVRLFVEERGMRAAPANEPHSMLGDWVGDRGAASLVEHLATMGDAVILDTRVIMAALASSSDPGSWPAAEERYAADFGDPSPITTPWLRELTEAAAAASVPFILGAHTLVSDGLRILTDLAWLNSPPDPRR